MELSQEVKVIKGLPDEWGTCYRTIMLDSPPPVLTCWKNTIAVGMPSGKIITLDGITGSHTAILSDHTNGVRSLAFSPDGRSLVSGSYDKTIKLWDVQTGGVIKTFYGHTECVLSISISADCTMIASGSADKSIRLWNIQTEECCHVIEQQDLVSCVRFSPTDPQYLISVSDCEVCQWDINGHQINPTFVGSNVAFSSDGTQFVSCQGEDIVVQNSNSGTTVAKFHMPNGNAYHCCFSPDGKLIAAADDFTSYIWDTTGSDPYPIKAFVGHTGAISSLEFSSASSLVSLSVYDHSVKFWKISPLSTNPLVTDSKSTPLTPTPIRSITLQAKDGVAISSDLDGVVRTWDISTGLCKASLQSPAKGPLSQRDVQLINGWLILVWSERSTLWNAEKIHILDVEKGRQLQVVGMDKGGAIDVRISRDGSKVFCLYWESVRALSIQTGEIVGEVKLEHSTHPRSLIVDGSKVWVHSSLPEPLGWDFGTPGSSPIQLSNMPPPYLNGTKLWDIGLSRIKDIVTGKVVLQLGGRFVKPTKAQWDGRYLVAGYESGEVLILDFNHMFL